MSRLKSSISPMTMALPPWLKSFTVMLRESICASPTVSLSPNKIRGIRTTCQFNSKIFDHYGPGKHLWCSDPLSHHKFDKERTSFLSEKCSTTLSADGNTYTIKSETNHENIVDLTVTKTAPGFMAGKDGTSHFGTDPKKPWGLMHHAFWPRCTVSGTMKTKSKTYNITGRAVYIHANQGMKPHHAAARWNFVNFQTPTYSAVMMEFTTPPSYGKTVVNVGCIAKDGELVYAGVTNSAKHVAAEKDPVSDWPEPKAILLEWKGKTKTGQDVNAEIMGDLGQKVDRVDVLAHIPTIIKNLIGGVVGTKPIIYQVSDQSNLAQ